MLADAVTSILAITALVVAMASQWVWADPAVGIIGSLVIASWAFGLIRASGAVLLDASADRGLEAIIRERIETEGVHDLVIATHVLEHVPRPADLVAELVRVGRTVVLEVPLEDNLRKRPP